jgi:alkylation response protein AidB-like acyl-CoA dehydrogenase
MEFGWAEEQAGFRVQLQNFLDRTLPAEWDAIAGHGPGSDAQSRFSREFCPKLAQNGFLVPHWPRKYGGRDATTWEHFIIGEEMWSRGEPRGPQYMNVNWIGPALMRFGSEAQQLEHLPPMARGEVIWCQGFSEPNAGSDLASLRTRADKRGDDYLVNGSKIWTSYASQAEFCFLLARTGADRKGGIAIFLVPMSTPGITVRKIPALIGEGDIHEVFFQDVPVRSDWRLGSEGQGWEIIMYALRHERVGIPRYSLARRALDLAVRTLRLRGAFDIATVRARAGLALAACEAARLLVYRVVDLHSKGGSSDAGEGPLARSAVIAAERSVTEFVVEFLPEELTDKGHPLFRAHHQRAIAAGIASGAAEIQLDLIARTHLQLPRDSVRAA